MGETVKRIHEFISIISIIQAVARLREDKHDGTKFRTLQYMVEDCEDVFQDIARDPAAHERREARALAAMSLACGESLLSAETWAKEHTVEKLLNTSSYDVKQLELQIMALHSLCNSYRMKRIMVEAVPDYAQGPTRQRNSLAPSVQNAVKQHVANGASVIASETASQNGPQSHDSDTKRIISSPEPSESSTPRDQTVFNGCISCESEMRPRWIPVRGKYDTGSVRVNLIRFDVIRRGGLEDRVRKCERQKVASAAEDVGFEVDEHIHLVWAPYNSWDSFATDFYVVWNSGFDILLCNDYVTELDAINKNKSFEFEPTHLGLKLHRSVKKNKEQPVGSSSGATERNAAEDALTAERLGEEAKRNRNQYQLASESQDSSLDQNISNNSTGMSEERSADRATPALVD